MAPEAAAQPRLRQAESESGAGQAPPRLGCPGGLGLAGSDAAQGPAVQAPTAEHLIAPDARPGGRPVGCGAEAAEGTRAAGGKQHPHASGTEAQRKPRGTRESGLAGGTFKPGRAVQPAAESLSVTPGNCRPAPRRAPGLFATPSQSGAKGRARARALQSKQTPESSRCCGQRWAFWVLMT